MMEAGTALGGNSMGLAGTGDVLSGLSTLSIIPCLLRLNHF